MGLKPRRNSLPPSTDSDQSSPSADRTSRFAIDCLIRRHGYKIHTRKGLPHEPLWEKQGVVLAQSELLDTLDENDLYDAYMEQAFYYEGL